MCCAVLCCHVADHHHYHISGIAPRAGLVHALHGYSCRGRARHCHVQQHCHVRLKTSKPTDGQTGKLVAAKPAPKSPAGSPPPLAAPPPRRPSGPEHPSWRHCSDAFVAHCAGRKRPARTVRLQHKRTDSGYRGGLGWQWCIQQYMLLALTEMLHTARTARPTAALLTAHFVVRWVACDRNVALPFADKLTHELLGSICLAPHLHGGAGGCVMSSCAVGTVHSCVQCAPRREEAHLKLLGAICLCLNGRAECLDQPPHRACVRCNAFVVGRDRV